MKHFIDFTNKTFLVTGATSGIGLEICNQIADYGGNIIAVGRNTDKLLELSNRFAGKITVQPISYNLENLNNIDELLEQVKAPIDGVVHSAGVVKLLPIKFFDLEQYTKIRNVNYDSIILICAKLLKQKKINNNGSLVFISSVAAQTGMKGNLMYATTKASLDISAKVFASEFSNLGIRANTIAPGQVETPLTEKVSAVVSEEAIEQDKKKYPLGYGKPDDIAALTMFLLSDKSRWITGTTITIDGGRTNVLN